MLGGGGGGDALQQEIKIETDIVQNLNKNKN
jgi:hypothetical protein